MKPNFYFKYFNLLTELNLLVDVSNTENNHEIKIKLCAKLNKLGDYDSDSLNSINHTLKVILSELDPQNDNYIKKLIIILHFLYLQLLALNQSSASAGNNKNGDDDDDDDDKGEIDCGFTPYIKSVYGKSSSKNKQKKKINCIYYPLCECVVGELPLCYNVAFAGNNKNGDDDDEDKDKLISRFPVFKDVVHNSFSFSELSDSNQSSASAGNNKNGDDDDDDKDKLISRFPVYKNSVNDDSSSKNKQKQIKCSFFPECKCVVDKPTLCYSIAVLGNSVTPKNEKLKLYNELDKNFDIFIKEKTKLYAQKNDVEYFFCRYWFVENLFDIEESIFENECAATAEKYIASLFHQDYTSFRNNNIVFNKNWYSDRPFRKHVLTNVCDDSEYGSIMDVVVPDKVKEGWQRLAMGFGENFFVPYDIYKTYAELLVPYWTPELYKARQESSYFYTAINEVRYVFRYFGCVEEWFLELFFRDIKKFNRGSFYRLRTEFWNIYYGINESFIDHKKPISEYFVDADIDGPIPIINNQLSIKILKNLGENSDKKI